MWTIQSHPVGTSQAGTHATATSESHRLDAWHRVTEVVALASLVIVPLVLLPVFDNFLITSKYIWVFVFGLVFLGLFFAQAVKMSRMQIALSPLTLPLSLLLIGVIVSSFFTNGYPVEALWGMGGVMISVTLVSLLISSLLPRSHRQWLWQGLALLGSVLAVTTLLQAVGVGPSRLISTATGFEIPHTIQFNLTGSPFVAAQLLGLAALGLGLRAFWQRQRQWWVLAGFGLSLVGLLASVVACLPGQIAAPIFMPFAASWSLAIDTLRFPRSALIGVGLESYGDAYQIYKPLWINGGTYANILFTQGTNGLLTFLVTIGLIGTASWVWLLVNSVRWFKQTGAEKADARVVGVLVLATFVLELLFPLNAQILWLQALVIGYWIALNHGARVELQTLSARVVRGNSNAASHLSKIGLGLTALTGVVLVGGLTAGLVRASLASYHILQGAKALQASNGIALYDAHRQAVSLNPYIDSYRQAYAITNIQLAAALANKTDLTKTEQEQVSQLIQQAIREARAATVLNPLDSQNWRVLGQIYRQLIGTAQDADQWSVSAYVQAIQVAPNDSNLRLELGGILYTQGQFAQAASLFQQSAELKPDNANAFYNLANALRELGQYDQAEQAYERTLALIPPETDNFKTASQELAEVQKIKAASASAQTTPAENQGTNLLNQALQTPSEVVSPAETSLPLNAIEPAAAQPSASPAAATTTPVQNSDL